MSKMHSRVSLFFWIVLSLFLTSCASQRANKSPTDMERNASALSILDLRLSNVEEAIVQIESSMGVLRDEQAALRDEVYTLQPAKKRARAKKAKELVTYSVKEKRNNDSSSVSATEPAVGSTTEPSAGAATVSATGEEKSSRTIADLSDSLTLNKKKEQSHIAPTQKQQSEKTVAVLPDEHGASPSRESVSAKEHENSVSADTLVVREEKKFFPKKIDPNSPPSPFPPHKNSKKISSTSSGSAQSSSHVSSGASRVSSSYMLSKASRSLKTANDFTTGVAEYDAALQQYLAKKYQAAFSMFRDFIAAHPSSILVPNSLYWQGECLYALRQYPEAILQFKDLLTKFPQHAKSADALLKIGMSYEKLQDMDNARFHWEILLEDFPKSTSAQLAKKYLNR